MAPASSAALWLAVLGARLRIGGALSGGAYSMCVVPMPKPVFLEELGLSDSLSMLTTSTGLGRALGPVPITALEEDAGWCADDMGLSDSLSMWTKTTSVRAAMPVDLAKPAGIVAPEVPEDAGWEAQFAWGVYHSQQFLQLDEPGFDGWVSDTAGSGAGVPAAMLRAEDLLRAAEDAPPEQAKVKLAERALRVYNHAKWLAERSYGKAAEFRFRLASDMAKQARRSVLASHALSRLGYFLAQWGRHEEAMAVVEESQKLNGKSNPLAIYLHAVLQRKAAGADAASIKKAEDRLLAVATLPSEELEDERAVLAEEIAYWRSVEESPRHCLRTLHAANALICLCAHGGLAVSDAVRSIR